MHALRDALRDLSTVEERGRITEVLGPLVKAVGVKARIGDLCELRTRPAKVLRAEIIATRASTAILTPFGETAGLSNDTEVVALRQAFTAPSGHELLGRILDGFGTP